MGFSLLFQNFRHSFSSWSILYVPLETLSSSDRSTSSAWTLRSLQSALQCFTVELVSYIQLTSDVRNLLYADSTIILSLFNIPIIHLQTKFCPWTPFFVAIYMLTLILYYFI
jgi:hypothetical protein